MAFRSLTMTFFLPIASAPPASDVVTIIGSISGVIPTATDIANSRACVQSPFVNPLTNSTTGTMTSMKRMSIHETAPTPFSNVVFGGFAPTLFATAPSMVSFPVASTTALALPMMTLEPMNARFSAPVRLSGAAKETA